MGRIRRKYTAEFKREAVALVTEQGYAVTVAARNLGINPNLLHRWKAAVQQHQAEAFPGQGYQTPEQAELRQLREDNRRLRMERDILKKATAFFANHHT
jgi:transposase